MKRDALINIESKQDYVAFKFKVDCDNKLVKSYLINIYNDPKD